MCKIILPIKPKYANDLLDGVKLFELRRSIPKRSVDEIHIYETQSNKKVVGKMIIKKTHKLPLNKLWVLTKGCNSLTKKEFMDYFEGKTHGFAYEIKDAKRYKRKKSLDSYSISFAPQGFVYIG